MFQLSSRYHADPEIIAGIIRKLDGVVDAEVVDTYCGIRFQLEILVSPSDIIS